MVLDGPERVALLVEESVGVAVAVDETDPVLVKDSVGDTVGGERD